MAKGGARPGAGRKKGPATIEREKVKDYIAQRITENVEPIVDVLISKATKGDVIAIKELFDRGFGRATQAVDVTTKGEAINTPISDIQALAAEAAALLKKKKL